MIEVKGALFILGELFFQRDVATSDIHDELAILLLLKLILRPEATAHGDTRLVHPAGLYEV